MLEMIVLPRQAQDKRRESTHSKEGDHFLAGIIDCVLNGMETPLLAPFIYKMHHFAKTGSGQT
jgi:hypothetical protein